MQTRFRCLKKDYLDALSEVYLQFYVSALPLFTNFNRFMQCSDPQGHNVQPMLKHLISKIAQCFLKLDVLKELITSPVLQTDDNYLPLQDINIGLTTRALLDVMFEEGDISSHDRDYSSSTGVLQGKPPVRTE